MTALRSPGWAGTSVPERRAAGMVLDVKFTLDGLVADLIRHELDRGARVHILLSLPRRGWSTDAAPVALRARDVADVTVTSGPRKQARRGEVYDLGDDLMEHVSLRGGQLALVRDGDLRAHERIALSSRR